MFTVPVAAMNRSVVAVDALYLSTLPTSGNQSASGISVKMLEPSTMQWGEWKRQVYLYNVDVY